MNRLILIDVIRKTLQIFCKPVLRTFTPHECIEGGNGAEIGDNEGVGIFSNVFLYVVIFSLFRITMISSVRVIDGLGSDCVTG